MSRLDIGRRVDEHVRPDTPALQGFAFARCCGFSSASIPHALTGKVGSGSRRFRPHAVAYDLWLPPVGSIRDLHPPPFIHARRTQSPYGLLPIPPRSLSLPTYSCVDPPPPSTLISRGEVSHRGWHRGLHPPAPQPLHPRLLTSTPPTEAEQSFLGRLIAPQAHACSLKLTILHKRCSNARDGLERSPTHERTERPASGGRIHRFRSCSPGRSIREASPRRSLLDGWPGKWKRLTMSGSLAFCSLPRTWPSAAASR